MRGRPPQRRTQRPTRSPAGLRMREAVGIEPHWRLSLTDGGARRYAVILLLRNELAGGAFLAGVVGSRQELTGTLEEFWRTRG